MTRPWRAALALVAAVLGILVLAGPAQAHAELVGTDPADGQVLPVAPGAVRLEFDEAVTVPSGGVSVFDPDGRLLATRASESGAVVTVALPSAMPDGTYSVVWHLVSDDDHPVVGGLTFSVGAPSDQAPLRGYSGEATGSTAVSAVQGIGYVALLLSCGLILFETWVVSSRRVQRVSSWSALAAAVALGIHVPFQSAYLGAWSLELLRDDILVAVVATLGLAMALGVRRFGDDPGAAKVATTAGPLLAAVTPALVGHTRAFEPVPLLVASDVVHLVSGAIWFGGLVGLALTLPGAPDGRAVLARFSRYAGISVGLLVVTGSLMAWRILGSWSGLVTTPWGRVLLAKLCVVSVLLVIAAWNRRRLASASLTRVVRVEAGLVVVVLLLAGFLANQSPSQPSPRPAVSDPARSASLGGLQVRATLSPGRSGGNTLSVQLRDGAGAAARGGPRPVFMVRGPTDLGQVPLERTAPGTWSGRVLLDQPGLWVVRVRRGHDVAALRFVITS